MVILQDALEGLKGLLRSVELSDRARTAVIRCITAFVLPAGRMSASQAARAIRSEPCHRAQIGRFLKRSWGIKRNLLGHVQLAVLAMDAGSGQFVLLVVSTTEKPHRGKSLHDPKLLMNNDTSLTPQRLVERYALRWQIELFFKELKSTLGLHQYRFQDFRQVEHGVDLVLTTFLYLEGNRARQLARRDLAETQRRWWESQRTHGLCQAVRLSSELCDLFTIRDRLKTPGGVRKPARILRNALPIESRTAM